MEQLNRLIKDASNQFECHNFQTALTLYVRCIQKCEKQRLPTYVLHNLKSSQAAIRAILGEQEIALSILDQVLQKDKQHWACLMRRSQIYKKQNKLKKSMKDLQILSMYAPDNMQIAAFKLQLKTLMNKNNDDSFGEQSSEEDIIDEEKSLVFSGLKKIDRCSVSIMIPSKSRQSRVTITGDKSYFYESEKMQKGPKQSLLITPHFIRKKFIQVEQQLQQTGDSEQSQSPVIIVKSKPNRTKSILRNRDSAIYISDKKTDNLISTVEGKKLVQKLQNIEGSILGSQNGSIKNCSQKQVQFRKSSVQQDSQNFISIKIKKPAARKSCLKRPSFTATQDLNKNFEGGRRSSKFETLSRESIDGKLIRSDKKKISIQKEASKQNLRVSCDGDSADQSQSGSQFNIFGTKKPILNESLKENLGFGSDQIREIQVPEKKTKSRTSSILKKTSILVTTSHKNNKQRKEPSIFFRETMGDQQNAEPQRKPKKSVMFTTC